MKTALLETSGQILRDFQNEFAKTGQLNEKDNAYAWLYGARRYHPLIHRMRENRPLPSFYTQAAKPLFDKWLEFDLPPFFKRKRALLHKSIFSNHSS